MSLYGVWVVSRGGMMIVCFVWQEGQSFSDFTFSTRGFDVFAELLFLVNHFHTVFRRGNSKIRISTTRINTYEDCLFKRRGFPCRVKWQSHILLHFSSPSITNHRLWWHPTFSKMCARWMTTALFWPLETIAISFLRSVSTSCTLCFSLDICPSYLHPTSQSSCCTSISTS